MYRRGANLRPIDDIRSYNRFYNKVSRGRAHSEIHNYLGIGNLGLITIGNDLHAVRVGHQ